MRSSTIVCAAGLMLTLAACAELDELVAAGTTEGKALLNRLNTAVNAPAEGDAAAIAAAEPPASPAEGTWGRAVAPALPAPAAPADRPARLVPGAARERFLAAYALLGCAQEAAADPIDRERRRAELFRLLNYSSFDWLDDLQTYGTADAEALKALCRR